MSKKTKLTQQKLEELSRGGELWESGELGESPEYVEEVSDEHEVALDDRLGLQLISIRLSKTLIAQFKAFADLEGIGYQPFIRQVLETYEQKNRHKLGQAALPQSRSEIKALVRERDKLRKENERLKKKRD